MARPPKYPADEVVHILSLADSEGPTIEEICFTYDISVQTFYRWQKRFGGVPADQAPKLRELILEHDRLKRLKKKTQREIKALQEALEQEW
jgi:putative transposase